MPLKVIFVLLILLALSKAEDFCPDSTINVDGLCLTVEDISQTSGTAGHISSAFYGLGSGFNSVYGIIYDINSLSAGNKNSNQAIRMLPSSITFITSGTINQMVKIKRREMLEKLGVRKMKCRSLLIIGAAMFVTSVATDITHNISYLTDNDSFQFSAMLLNSTMLTSSFIVNVIGKVVQAKELDQQAEDLLKGRNISFAPYFFYERKKSGAGITLNF